MHSPKKKKKLSSNTLQTEHVQTYNLGEVSYMSYQEIRGGHWHKGRITEDRIKQGLYTMQRINPLGSTVSITSMLYCIYRLILLLWV
ncbi:unnamed protein product [Staurois parvus]|uniref:Uncharacterized protein n=1 Tax=Staurois parvus TaxID=386267 RepID=A0ABN9C2T5_9NEOB|nr:unnamed protein product [Staurois parvus]